MDFPFAVALFTLVACAVGCVVVCALSMYDMHTHMRQTQPSQET